MKLFVTTRENEALIIEGDSDISVMEAIRNNGIDELQALCGGQLSCATCHVYVDSEVLDRLPPITGFENDLLDSSDHRKPNSRLACQIPCSGELNEIRVVIAPED
jgi:2Fe-2S ferredoxin